MPSVVSRYLFSEAARTWLVVAGVLVFLTLGLGFASYIADAAAGELPVNTVLTLAAFSLVENLGIVLPISVLLAILLTLGRLCRDSEMTALFAGGIGLGGIYRPFFTLAIAVAIFAGALSVFAAPHAERAINTLGAASATTMIESLSAGRFRTFLDGDAVFYAKSRDADDNLRDVFIRVVRKDKDGKPTETVVTADRARQQTDADTGQVTLVLDDGYRYEGQPGQPDYRIIKFAEHGVQVAPPSSASSDDVDTQTIGTLLARTDPEAAAEWQERVSVPLSILILTLLALPIGRVPPRAGRYARVIVGILFYIVYVNAVHLATVSVEEGALPAWLGVWWVHALVLAVALALVAHEHGISARLRSSS